MNLPARELGRARTTSWGSMIESGWFRLVAQLSIGTLRQGRSSRRGIFVVTTKPAFLSTCSQETRDIAIFIAVVIIMSVYLVLSSKLFLDSLHIFGNDEETRVYLHWEHTYMTCLIVRVASRRKKIFFHISYHNLVNFAIIERCHPQKRKEKKDKIANFEVVRLFSRSHRCATAIQCIYVVQLF